MDLEPLRTRALPLGDLAQVVGALCARFPGTIRDERVRAAPDERTLRYYQSLGLLDRPLRYEGRVAIYGFRHVLQAVAAKALQGAGYSLAQVQTALAGVPTAELEQAVRDALGGGAPPPVPTPVTPAPILAFRLAPGLTLTVDAAQVADPEALARALAQAALPFLSSNGATS